MTWIIPSSEFRCNAPFRLVRGLSLDFLSGCLRTNSPEPMCRPGWRGKWQSLPQQFASTNLYTVVDRMSEPSVILKTQNIVTATAVRTRTARFVVQRSNHERPHSFLSLQLPRFLVRLLMWLLNCLLRRSPGIIPLEASLPVNHPLIWLTLEQRSKGLEWDLAHVTVDLTELLQALNLTPDRTRAQLK